jgi:hypothetical protein
MLEAAAEGRVDLSLRERLERPPAPGLKLEDVKEGQVGGQWCWLLGGPVLC